MKKWLLCSFVVVLLVSFTACSPSAEHETIKIGIAESDEAIWNYIAKKAEEAGLDIQLIPFLIMRSLISRLLTKKLMPTPFKTFHIFSRSPKNTN